MALNQTQNAIDAFQKALFIAPDDVAASVHLCRIYLTPPSSSNNASAPSRAQPPLRPRAPSQFGTPRMEEEEVPDSVDLAAGILSRLTQGAGWDVPEAWYFLAKAYGMQGRKKRERECLGIALGLAERGGATGLAGLGICA